jgi:hypothetical protein
VPGKKVLGMLFNDSDSVNTNMVSNNDEDVNTDQSSAPGRVTESKDRMVALSASSASSNLHTEEKVSDRSHEEPIVRPGQLCLRDSRGKVLKAFKGRVAKVNNEDSKETLTLWRDDVLVHTFSPGTRGSTSVFTSTWQVLRQVFIRDCSYTLHPSCTEEQHDEAEAPQEGSPPDKATR